MLLLDSQVLRRTPKATLEIPRAAIPNDIRRTRALRTVATYEEPNEQTLRHLGGMQRFSWPLADEHSMAEPADVILRLYR